MNWSFIPAVSYFVDFQCLFFSTIERKKWLKIVSADPLSYLFNLISSTLCQPLTQKHFLSGNPSDHDGMGIK